MSAILLPPVDTSTPSANDVLLGDGTSYVKTTLAANKFIARSSSGNAAAKDISDAGLALIDDANAAAQRTTLGATTLGGNIFTLTNPSAITFIRINADNTATARTASELRSDLAVAGTGVANSFTAAQTITLSANAALTVEQGGGTDIFRVDNTNANCMAYSLTIGAGAVLDFPAGGNGEIRGNSFATITITNATLRWPSNSPDCRLLRDSSGILRFADSSTGRCGILVSSININSGTTITNALSATATLDFGSISAGATAELTITVTGAATGDSVFVGPPSGLEAGLIADGRVSASNTVTIRLHNTTGSSIDPASATWRATVIKF